MGWGDELIGSGLARGCAAKGQRMAFGDGRRIMWSQHAHEIFKGNPNVARPGSENDKDLVWCAHYGGHRLYGHFERGKWHWKKFQCIPGEVFLTEDELDVSKDIGIVIEARTKGKPNKQWPIDRYQEVADRLVSDGYTVSQLCAPNNPALLRGVQRIGTRSFRHALGALSKAQLYLGCEGGLHHGAAAFNIPAVVIFGGFIGPETTGYEYQRNIAVPPACGSQQRCSHCARIMDSITADEVYLAAKEQLEGIKRDLPRAAE